MLEPQVANEVKPPVRRLDQPRHDERRNHTPLPDTSTVDRFESAIETPPIATTIAEKKTPPTVAAVKETEKKDAKIPRIMEFIESKYKIKWSDLKPEIQQKLIILAEAKDLQSFKQLVLGSFESIHDNINPDNPYQLKDYLALLDGIKNDKIPALELFRGLAGYIGEQVPDIPELHEEIKAAKASADKPAKNNTSFLDKIIKGIDDFLEGILRFIGLSSNNPPKTATGTA